jgi:PhnB protein
MHKENTMRLNPYLAFDGQCEAAFTFYQQCLGGDIVMMLKYSGSPMAEQTPPDWLDKVMHGRLVFGDNVLMGSDNPPQYQTKAQGFHVSLSIDEPAEAEHVFEALSAGGTVTMPIQETFWALRFAMFVDRFGTPWMINCERPT